MQNIKGKIVYPLDPLTLQPPSPAAVSGRTTRHELIDYPALLDIQESRTLQVAQHQVDEVLTQETIARQNPETNKNHYAACYTSNSKVKDVPRPKPQTPTPQFA